MENTPRAEATADTLARFDGPRDNSGQELRRRIWGREFNCVLYVVTQFRSRPVPFLLLGIAALAWAGFSLVTGKGYYKGCPPGGFDRAENPLSYWAPTIILLGLGVCMMLIFLGVIHLPPGAGRR